MPQNNTIMAFRKRLKNLGYTEISIKFDPKVSRETGQRAYAVSGREPLANTWVLTHCTITQMHNLFH